MPLIKPVSELRNYPEVLKNVKAGCPVYLTRNGAGRYVILDIEDFDRLGCGAELGGELLRGRRSGKCEGWIGKAEMRQRFAERTNG